MKDHYTDAELLALAKVAKAASDTLAEALDICELHAHGQNAPANAYDYEKRSRYAWRASDALKEGMEGLEK